MRGLGEANPGVRRVTAASCLLFVACAAPSAQVEDPRDWTALHATRWLWVDAQCVDGRLPIAEMGFERELHVESRGEELLFVYDDALPARGCARSSVWRLSPTGEGAWRALPEVDVTVPPDTACGAHATEPLRARLVRGETTLELVEERSPWCRGLDARFTYRRGPWAQLGPEQLARRWTAHFNRRDARSLAALFARSGSLIEPFSPTEDGVYRRHEGRTAVRAWFESTFESTSWLALRLVAIDRLDGTGTFAARWQYMDAHLAAPFAGRNLLAVAGGEIYEAEIQLLEAPRQRIEAPSAQQTDEVAR